MTWLKGVYIPPCLVDLLILTPNYILSKEHTSLVGKVMFCIHVRGTSKDAIKSNENITYLNQIKNFLLGLMKCFHQLCGKILAVTQSNRFNAKLNM